MLNWKLSKDLHKHSLYVSDWYCQDGDGVELYIDKNKGGFELTCFSGMPVSHIYLADIDFSIFWEKVGLDKVENPDFETQCFMISDYLCSLFCNRG